MHGYARATLDIDLFVRPTPENAERVRAALTDFGYDLTSVTGEDLLTWKLLIRQYLVETDVSRSGRIACATGSARRRRTSPASMT